MSLINKIRASRTTSQKDTGSVGNPSVASKGSTTCSSGEPIRVTARNNTIIPMMVGALLHVHNGKEYVPLKIQEDMVGSRLWEYVRTTKPFTYRATNARKK
jgi:ribosomal protein S19